VIEIAIRMSVVSREFIAFCCSFNVSFYATAVLKAETEIVCAVWIALRGRSLIITGGKSNI
jgi:hypothetical protein